MDSERDEKAQQISEDVTERRREDCARKGVLV
jgi:hypothetical protein